MITMEEYERQVNINIELQQRIDKAIEYIEENKQKGYRIPMSEDYDFWNELNENEIKTLLDILKGEDK